jgi:CheY-like chemotaxis protein
LSTCLACPERQTLFLVLFLLIFLSFRSRAEIMSSPPAAELMPSSHPLALPGPAALRELARAFAHVADFQRFTAGLESALGRAEFFADARVRLLAEPGDRPEFSADHLTLPLAGAERLHGALHVGARPRGPEETREFGPEDLHLLSSLAAVLAAALDHAVRHGEQRRNLEILSFLLDLAPVGLAALHADGRVALANATARRWLGVGSADALAARLAPEALGADWRAQPQFYLRLDGRLIFGEARAHVAAGDGNGATAGHAANGSAASAPPAGAAAFVFVDLTPQQAQLMDGLERELYRCRWLGLRLSFALLESRQLPGGLLQNLPELRARLQPGELAGPYDAHRVGLVLPGLDPGAARARLRVLAAPPVAADFSAAIVAGEQASSAERVLTAALDRMRPAADTLRPALLLHDDYAAVNDALALLLRGRFELVKTTRHADAVAHLRARPFDALVTEVDLREGNGVELALLARQLQPGIRPVFTTVAHALPPAVADAALAGHLVLHKPFDVARLEETFAAALCPPASKTPV